MTKTREEKVSAAHGGNECEGLSEITESCNVQECPDTCSKGEDCAYVFTFQATGCPNKNPTSPKQMAWWRRQSDNKVFTDMLAYCVKVRDGTARSRQIRECCGEGVECMPSSCKRQSTWVLEAGINARVCLCYILFRLRITII